MKFGKILALWAGLLVVGVGSSASAKRIIADADICEYNATAQELKCCPPSQYNKPCATFEGCTPIVAGDYAGAWRCDSVEVRCGAGSGSDFRKCRVMRKPEKGKKPSRPPTKSPPKKGPTKRPSKKS